MRATAGLLAILCAAAAWGRPVEEAYRGADPVLLQQVRRDFAAAPDSAAGTGALIAALDAQLPADVSAWPPVFRAYRAALEGLAGKHAHLPWAKYRHAKAGLARFAGLVEAHPDSIEIRMLRYSTCGQLPELFGQRAQAAADLAALVEQFGQGADPMVDAGQRRGYIQWILDHGRPPPDLRARLEKLRAP